MQSKNDIESLVMHFGEMGSRWGFNRTVGQMLALIVLTEQPLNADQIAASLGVSRGNVSMGIKELQSWRLIRTQSQPGDRKDYFVPNGSIWDLAMQVMIERRKREMDPTLSMLRSHIMQADSDDQSYALSQMQQIHDLLEMFGRWFDDMQKLNPNQLQSLLKLGSSVGKVLDMKDRLFGSKD
ncbi:GbsR/MarR family transcriptional regulator [Bowmanella sp. JS7-9]|uniref:HTH-type transcriptional regulator n=1 Tax=Pseudobowmanella zhangzhouensis TaxID=1537679 RepID=A0ABW1XIX1_9ALTE|nr:MarR family transcriptional regulator [Bowmanella sp. JS7-9]TBX21406.1 ArsR family transcriptional regulator [Bowmanella sp. JS7-9]